MSDPIEKLTEYFRTLPGIGPRQASRFAYFIINKNSQFASEFSNALLNAKKEVLQCGKCKRFYSKDTLGTTSTLCKTCNDDSRNGSTLLIVEKDIDIDNIESAGIYNGRYFVLGGVIPVLEKEPGKFIRTQALLAVAKSMKDLKEVILALSVNPDADNTVTHVKNTMSGLTKEKNITFTLLGRGLSTGAELEYSDSDTLRSAFENRH
jgi:recombination protein RecR